MKENCTKQANKTTCKSYKINFKKEEKCLFLMIKIQSFLFEYGKNNEENKIRIETKYGDIDIELFNETHIIEQISFI